MAEFGSGLSSNCRECKKGFFNVAYVLASSIFLLGLTAITIRGTLSALRGETRRIPSHSASSSSSAEESDAPVPEQEVGAETVVAASSNRALQGQGDGGVLASEKVLAKWKAVEMFKV